MMTATSMWSERPVTGIVFFSDVTFSRFIWSIMESFLEARFDFILSLQEETSLFQGCYFFAFTADGWRIILLNLCGKCCCMMDVVSKDFTVCAGDYRFNSLLGLIGHSVTDGTPPLRRFFRVVLLRR